MPCKNVKRLAISQLQPRLPHAMGGPLSWPWSTLSPKIPVFGSHWIKSRKLPYYFSTASDIGTSCCFHSVTFLAGHGETCHPHGWSTWRSADQPTTRWFTWTWGLFKTIQEVHVNRRVVGWSADRHVDQPCGWQISPWLARPQNEVCFAASSNPTRIYTASWE